LVLQRSGIQHILERHHPTYFDPEQAKQSNDMFRESRTIDDIVDLIDQVIRQNTDEIEAIARKPRPEQQVGNVRGYDRRSDVPTWCEPRSYRHVPPRGNE
jgi:hypothetical protein